MHKKIRIILVASVIAAVGGIAVAARDGKDESKPAAPPPAGAPMAPQVPVAEAITRTITPSTEFTGFLAAPKVVELRSRVGGGRRRGERARGKSGTQGAIVVPD